MSVSSRRSKAQAEGPVAADEGAEAVENILWRGFANVLRLILLCGTQPRSGKSGGERAAVQTLREVCERWAVAIAFGVRWLQHRFPSALMNLGNGFPG